MKQGMESIDIFNNSANILYHKKPNSIKSWITILILLFIFMLIVINIPYSKYEIYQSKVIKIDGISYLKVRIDEVETPIYNNNNLYINYKKYLYKIKEINDNDIIIDINIPKSINIEGNIINIEIEKTKTTVLKKILKRIMKGLNI